MSSSSFCQNPDPFPLNQWVFVAFAHEGKSGKLYQDGRLVRENATMHAGDNHRGPGTFVGKIFNTHPPTAGDHFWDGMIDELRVHTSALSASDLSALQRERAPARKPGIRGETVTSHGDSPVFHLSFDDGTCRDQSGRDHHGKSHGAVAAQDDGAMRLDGLTAHISVQRSAAMTLNKGDNRSVLMWWKAELIDEQTQSLLSMRDKGDGARGLAVELFKGRFYRLHLRYYYHADFPAPLKASQWNHLAVVKEGTDWRLYHNGEQLTNPVLGNWPLEDHANAAVPLWIGRDHATDRPFQCSVDELVFFDRALSQNEIRHIHSKNRGWNPAASAEVPAGPEKAEISDSLTRQPDHRKSNLPKPTITDLKAGNLTITLLNALDGESLAEVWVELAAADPRSIPLREMTDSEGRAKFRVPLSARYQHLVRIGDRGLGIVQFSPNSEWSACTIVLPENYDDLPKEWPPDLVPQIVDGELFLIGTKTAPP